MSVPFKTEEFEGLAEVDGVVRFEDDELILEFQTRDAVFGVVKGELKELRVPLADLASVELAKGFFSTKLVVRTHGMRALAECPGNRAGRASLGIARRYRRDAEDLVTDVSLRISERAMEAAMRELDSSGS